ncbi:MAG: DUF87 domain-containing protein [Anaerolineales bacterium]|nr:DUF87 domain-containing protein [Anaerolineales bacterium]
MNRPRNKPGSTPTRRTPERRPTGRNAPSQGAPSGRRRNDPVRRIDPMQAPRPTRQFDADQAVAMRAEAPANPPDAGASRKKIAPPDPGFVRVVVLGNRLRKYSDDLLAILLLVLAALTLFALTGLSSGTLLEPWSGFLRQWFGWGAILVPTSLGLVGGGVLLHNLGRLPPVRWGRVIWGELAVFLLLTLFNYANGGSVLLAAEGQGGGVVGWAVGYIFQRVFAPADLFVVGFSFLVALVLALDITADRIERALRWLTSQGFADDPGRQLPLPLAESGAMVAEPEDVAPAKAAPTVVEEKARARLTKGERLKNVPVEASKTEARNKVKPKRDKRLPSLDMLDDLDLRRPAQREIDDTASIIVKTLGEFGVPVNVIGARVGPSVTQYQVEPGFVERPGVDGISKQWKVRVGQIASLQNDMALALSATTLRIEAPVPGQHYVGIEVPHRRTSVVGLRPVIESEAFQKIGAPLKLALGRDVSGAAIAADLGKMPHMLIAGTTGSGKSVAITSMVASLILTNTPDDLRIVMIDPKMVELVRFNGVPHLLGKVETEVTRILGVLRWTVREMERRYKLFETYHVRNLDTYMAKAAKKLDVEKLPRVAVFIDELADLMMQAPDETERMVVRLAQMARATGIHLVVATQRPSVDVVTGLIKANFPARIAFAVTSSIDSRVILDTVGAESLLGKGDMLFQSPEMQAPARVQGCFLSDKEIDRIVAWWKDQADIYAEEALADTLEIEADDMPPTVGGPGAAPPPRPPVGGVAPGQPAGGKPAAPRPVAEKLGPEKPLEKPHAELTKAEAARRRALIQDTVLPAPKTEADEAAARPAPKPERPARAAKRPAPEPEPVASAPAKQAAPWDEMLAREAAVEDKDQQIEQAIEIVKKHGTASASLLQRKMRIGYPRAARLMDELKAMGLIGREQQGGKTREVFMNKDDDPIGDQARKIMDQDEE